MPDPDHLQLARDLYGAYVSGERNVVEDMLSADFEFFESGRRRHRSERAEVYFGWDV